MSSAEDHRWWNEVPHPIDRDAVHQAVGGRARRAGPVSVGAHGTEAASREKTLSRAHAADFADAFDLDGAFGAPLGRGVERDADGGQVIVLERGLTLAPDAWAEEDLDDFPARAAVAPRRTLTLVTDDDEHTLAVAGSTVPAPRRREPVAQRDLEPLRVRMSVGERFALRPDRMGLYTVLLGIFLVVLAAASGGHA